MINLLPYDRRSLLKASYKKRLLVVGFFALSLVLVPLLLVLGVLAYEQHLNIGILSVQYEKLKNSKELIGTTELFNQVKNLNNSISFIDDSISSTKNVSLDIEKVLALRPDDMLVKSIEFSKSDNVSTLNITGIAESRDSIIRYASFIDVKNSGICKSVSIPVGTYTKKNEVPFNITCVIEYEAR
jgi:hypothetical protein